MNENMTTAAETTKTIYHIPEGNMARLLKEIGTLNRRAIRLGVSPISITETGNVEIVENKDEVTGLVTSVTRIVEIALIGATPKFAGWTLAATLEHTPEGNIIRTVPGLSVNLMGYKDCKPGCEHCNLARNRKDTYLVTHDDGAIKQVGHDCIRDFLGHKSPQHLADMAELLFSAGELCGASEGGEGGSGGSDRGIFARTFMAYCARAIRQYGYVSRKAMEEAEMAMRTNPSTKNTVLQWMFPPRDPSAKARIAERDCLDGERWPTPSEADSALVDIAREHVVNKLSAKCDLNEFENNILICAKLEALAIRTCGIAAYVVEYYRRDVAQAEERARKIANINNTHFGDIGKRYKSVSLTYAGCSSFDSAYGVCYIHRFDNAEGQRLVWKTSTGLGLSDGTKVTATFTVKEHGEYKGFTQTKISRVTGI
jgi:hypothetical protein